MGNKSYNEDRLILEGEQFYFVVNGQKVRPEDVKFMPAERVALCCNEDARKALASGALKAIRITGSIAPPVRRIRRRYRAAGGDRYPAKNPY